MKWDVGYRLKSGKLAERRGEILEFLLADRGLETQEDIDGFLNPENPLEIGFESVGIDGIEMAKAVELIKKAVEAGTRIIVYGDYDADGITASAILWEALDSLGAKAKPFIPNRERHGYGLSKAGIDECLVSIGSDNKPLFITVDNGIVAHEAAEYLSSLGIPLIITDHHQKAKEIPKCEALVHTDTVAGSAVAWFLAKELSLDSAEKSLDLVAIGTVADLLPLMGVNRSLVKFGLESLGKTGRLGLRELYREAGVDVTQPLSTYHIGYIIGPRLNAMGRLEEGMDSLRLLCTRKLDRARELASLLGETNKLRQDLTFDLAKFASEAVEDGDEALIVVVDDSFHEGIIGLIAGKLTEKFYRPSIVICRNEEVSKASARSVPGVNIIELIRSQEDYLVNAGGHPLAAGFSIETDKIDGFIKSIKDHAKKTIDVRLLEKSLDIDCEVGPDDINWQLYEEIEKLKPFGMGNPRPVFSSSARVTDARAVGQDGSHLKLSVQSDNGLKIGAIGFRLGDKLEQVEVGKTVNLAFVIDQNTWNGNTSLQMRLKDVSARQGDEVTK